MTAAIKNSELARIDQNYDKKIFLNSGIQILKNEI